MMDPEHLLDLLTLPEMAGNPDRRRLEAAFRGLCHTVPVDAHTVLCRILGRYKFFVDSRDEGLAPHLMLDGYWEFWVTDFMLNNVRPGVVACDVGANLGYYSVLMGELVGPEGALYAVEPNPRLAELLRRNIAINGFTRWSTISGAAAYRESGKLLSFRVSTADPKNGALIPNVEEYPEDGVSLLTVPTITLDDLCPGPVDFVKIDVEGAEEAVWEGMQRLIDRSADILILLEFNAGRCGNPLALLGNIGSRFTLRQLDYDGVVRSSAVEELLARTEDTMLVLSNRPILDRCTRA